MRFKIDHPSNIMFTVSWRMLLSFLSSISSSKFFFYQLSVCHFQNCDLSFIAQITEGKEICKLFVQRGLGLVSEDISASRITRRVPLVVCITRLVAQKGLHLITHAIKHVEELVSLLPFYYAHISCPLVMSGAINICNTAASLQNNIKFYLFIA